MSDTAASAVRRGPDIAIPALADLAKLPEEGARHGSTYLGAGSMQRSHLGDRVVKRVISGESGAGPAR